MLDLSNTVFSSSSIDIVHLVFATAQEEGDNQGVEENGSQHRSRANEVAPLCRSTGTSEAQEPRNRLRLKRNASALARSSGEDGPPQNDGMISIGLHRHIDYQDGGEFESSPRISSRSYRWQCKPCAIHIGVKLFPDVTHLCQRQRPIL